MDQNQTNRFNPFPNPNPIPRGSGHRRHHSETLFRLPDDLLFDSDPDFNFSDIDIPSLSDDIVSAHVGPTSSSEAVSAGIGGGDGSGIRHGRSLSIDAGFMEGMAGIGFHGGSGGAQSIGRGRHKRSGSMDEVDSMISSMAVPSEYAKKAMAPEKLAELALIDPKRARRILANRQSAVRSKERKIRYTSELERRVQTLQSEATTISTQLTLLQRDTTKLTAENTELKLRLEAKEQEAHLREALNNALKDEVHRLKVATGEITSTGGSAYSNNFSRYLSHRQNQQIPNANISRPHHQNQQIPNANIIGPQHQVQNTPNGQSHNNQSQVQNTPNGQSHSSQSQNSSMNYM